MGELKVTAAALLLAFAGTGAAGGAPPVAPDELDDRQILAVDDEMRRFVEEHAGTLPKAADRLSALKNAIFLRRPRGLGLSYSGHENRTARETFESGEGNCLSFTNLFVALAREIDLQVYFSEVDDELTQDLRGESLVHNRHMLVTVEIENARFYVDFTPDRERGRFPGPWTSGRPTLYRGVRRISDQRAAAHFFNNLGVEHLLEGGPETSLPYFEKAVELGPELAPAWINRGVALRRRGSFAQAEESYHRALEIDRSESATYTNLAHLYQAWGCKEMASRARFKDHRGRSALCHLGLGQRALEAGDLLGAVSHFRRSVEQEPREAPLHFALGDALYRLGELGEASASLGHAVELARDDRQQAHYRRALEAVETLRAMGSAVETPGAGGL